MSERDQASPPAADVEREIGRTRADIAQTLDALEHRLGPRHLVDVGIDMFNNSFGAGEAVNRGLATVRANPVPFALIGIGAAWLIAANAGFADRVARGDRIAGVQRRAGETASNVGSVATDMASRIGNGHSPSSEQPLGHTGNPMLDPAEKPSDGWAHHISDVAQGAMRTVRDSSGVAINRAGAYAEDGAAVVADRLNDTFERHPLMMGAIGALAGAVVAALLPLTRTEAEWVGNARERAWRRAEEVGQQAVDRVRDAASQAISRAANAANAAVATIKEELGEPSRSRE